jgi:hypothetical protein
MNDIILRKRSPLVEQELIRAVNTDDDFRLPNVHRIMPHKIYEQIAFQGKSRVDIYRCKRILMKEDKIRHGDRVFLRQSDVPIGEMLTKNVNSHDVVWGGSNESDWYYYPIKGLV